MSDQTEPRAHHYLPQCFLKGFAVVAKKRKVIWVYTKGEPSRKSTVANEAHERDFYAVEADGKKRHEFEVMLSGIENIAAPVLERVRRDSAYELTDPDRATLAIFTALMFYRVHHGRAFLDQLAVEAVTKVLRTRAANQTSFTADYHLIDAAEGWQKRAEEFRQDVLQGRLDMRQTSKAFNLRYVIEATSMLAPLLGEME